MKRRFVMSIATSVLFLFLMAASLFAETAFVSSTELAMTAGPVAMQNMQSKHRRHRRWTWRRRHHRRHHKR